MSLRISFQKSRNSFFGDGSACGEQAVVFALPVIIDGGGSKAVAQIKFAAAISAFEFLGVLGIFFNFDINDDAGVRMLIADGLQNL